MKELLSSGTNRLIMLVKIQALPEKGGDLIAIARHTRKITFDGTTYDTMEFTPSEFSLMSGLSTNNATMKTILADTFNRINLVGSKWQGATLEVSIIDWAHPEYGVARRNRGRLGEVTTGGVEAESEFRGLMQLLSQEIGDKTSRRCRYQLGDDNCMLDLTNYTFDATVRAVNSNQRFNINLTQPDAYFYRGQVFWQTGANAGLKMETASNAGDDIFLFLPMQGAIAVGDTLKIVAGDDKSLHTCHNKFANAINHGGEDSMPTKEKVYSFPE